MIVQFNLHSECVSVNVTPFHQKELSSESVQLPQWVTWETWEILRDYLEDRLKDEQTKLQRPEILLRLSDVLGMDRFAELVIKKYVMPHINQQNCLTFLMESYRKLNARQDDSSQVTWYQMLNLSMNTAAKNLEWLHQSQSANLNMIQPKILQQIMQRCFKFRRSSSEKQSAIFIMQSLRLYRELTLVDILNQRRKLLTEKRVYHENSANIIKTINLKNQKAQKQTNSFALNDFTWKLITRKKEERLQIWLKILERASSQPIPHEVVSVYFHSKVQKLSSEKHYRKSNLILQLLPQVLVTEFNTQPFKNMMKERIEFSMFVSFDYTSSAILSYLVTNWRQQIVDKGLLTKLHSEDFKVLMMRIKQSEDINDILKWASQYPSEQRQEEPKQSKIPQVAISLPPPLPTSHPLSQNRLINNTEVRLTSSLKRPLSRQASSGKLVNSLIKTSGSSINRLHNDIMDRIDITHFIRSGRPDILAEFKPLRPQE